MTFFHVLIQCWGKASVAGSAAAIFGQAKALKKLAGLIMAGLIMAEPINGPAKGKKRKPWLQETLAAAENLAQVLLLFYSGVSVFVP